MTADNEKATPDDGAVPWETLRKAVKAPAKLGWWNQVRYYRQHAHEVWHNPLLGWDYFVLKSYSKDTKALNARAFCLVDGYETELGDVYWADIRSYGSRRLTVAERKAKGFWPEEEGNDGA